MEKITQQDILDYINKVVEYYKINRDNINDSHIKYLLKLSDSGMLKPSLTDRVRIAEIPETTIEEFKQYGITRDVIFHKAVMAWIHELMQIVKPWD